MWRKCLSMRSNFRFSVLNAGYEGDQLPLRLRKLGYSVDQHIKTTRDKYKLKLFRVQKNNKNTIINDPSKKVVYMQHGLFDSADTFVINKQQEAPGLILARLGYDVWLGNTRGNLYSAPDFASPPNFWDFTFDQMIEHDLPSMFEFINEYTEQKIHYIGHSQGTLIMFAALCQQNTTIQRNLASFTALAPVAYLQHAKAPIIQISKIVLGNFIRNYDDQNIFHQLFTKILKQVPSMFNLQKNINVSQMMQIFQLLYPKFTEISLMMASDGNPAAVNTEIFKNILGRFPSGTSLRNLLHFAQFVLKKKFCKYDYLPTENLKRYNSQHPPQYNLNNIRVPVNLLVGGQDLLATKQDVESLQKMLVNCPKINKKIYQDKGHAAFIWGRESKYIYDDVVPIIQGK